MKVKFGKKNCHATLFDNVQAFTSYKTLVAVFDELTNTLYVTRKKFSVTTSKHISFFKKECKYPKTIEVDHDVLQNVLSQLLEK